MARVQVVLSTPTTASPKEFVVVVGKIIAYVSGAAKTADTMRRRIGESPDAFLQRVQAEQLKAKEKLKKEQEWLAAILALGEGAEGDGLVRTRQLPYYLADP